jgi:hypothetical protein
LGGIGGEQLSSGVDNADAFDVLHDRGAELPTESGLQRSDADAGVGGERYRCPGMAG